MGAANSQTMLEMTLRLVPYIAALTQPVTSSKLAQQFRQLLSTSARRVTADRPIQTFKLDAQEVADIEGWREERARSATRGQCSQRCYL